MPYYIGVLHELIEIGVDLTRQVQVQAKTENHVAADLAVAFDRLSRAVRRSIMLAHRLGQPAPDVVQAGSSRDAARKRIIREVEDAIQREAAADRAELLHAELLERLDSPDLDDEIGDRPVDDIIADICRDLGIAGVAGAHPWKRRTPRDLAVLCDRAGAACVPRAALGGAARWVGDGVIRGP